MSELFTDQITSGEDLGNTFDSDFQQDNTLQEYHQEIPRLDVNSFSRQDIFDSHDPLQHANNYRCPPLDLNVGNQHFVDPHSVDGYTRSDGIYVDGYYRDGDGNTAVNRSEEEGGGYIKTNP